ncbi:GGDEF domain-containing protein [Marinomonas pollencensis]|uniref:diguanylate cyclase n=1 Tax=Marinomonas pollencensis TaxID=491954 RepID=A0A3E0DGW5_9GAMM|nr:GGDEF domain-containing protein [Marinomonas pollencensis]REG81315.1 diguanylate cyclase (GGDEF)-like protein [Marinomonas pollencensis]
MADFATEKLRARKQIGFRLNLVLLGVLCFYLIITAYSVFILWQQSEEFKHLTNTQFERAIHAAELSRDAEQITSQALEKMIVQDYNNTYYQSLSNTPRKLFDSIRNKLYATTDKEKTILDEIDNITTPYFSTLKILDHYLLREEELTKKKSSISNGLSHLQESISSAGHNTPQQQYFNNLFLNAINITLLSQNSVKRGELQAQKNAISGLLAKMYYLDNLSSAQSSLLDQLFQTAQFAFSTKTQFQNQHLATLSAIRKTRQQAQRLSAASYDFYLLLKIATLDSTQKHDALIRDVITNIVLFSCAFLVLTAFAYWFIRHYLIFRLNRLNNTMLQHVKGVKAPIPQSGEDEIALMGKAFSVFVEATEQAKRDSITARKEVEDANLKLLQLNQSLQTLSHTDDLTQLSNRRFFFKKFTEYWKKASIEQHDISLIMIDLDWFKQFNDHYGHQAGDKCLIEIAQILKTDSEAVGGLAARYGGEEFIILLPNIDRMRAMTFAKHLRRKVGEADISHEASNTGRVTLSIGVATHQPKPGDDLDKLIYLADQTLYEAKKSGRDQVLEFVES